MRKPRVAWRGIKAAAERQNRYFRLHVDSARRVEGLAVPGRLVPGLLPPDFFAAAHDHRIRLFTVHARRVHARGVMTLEANE